jgi:hypothetical protein
MREWARTIAAVDAEVERALADGLLNSKRNSGS